MDYPLPGDRVFLVVSLEPVIPWPPLDDAGSYSGACHYGRLASLANPLTIH
jgi:hypothetical protein